MGYEGKGGMMHDAPGSDAVVRFFRRVGDKPRCLRGGGVMPGQPPEKLTQGLLFPVMELR